MPEPARPAATAPLHPSPYATALAGAIALLAWGALAAQTGITIERMVLRGFDTLEAIGRLSAYLTNLTVLLVALTFTCIALRLRAWPARFFSAPGTVSAVTVYIVFVGIAYNVLLRHLWTPHGYRALLNESLHTLIPLLCASYWLLFVPRFTLGARDRLAWLVYPLGYLVVTFWRGSETDFYPYPFIDVRQLGYAHVLVNSALLLAAFMVLMAVFVTINARRRPAIVTNEALGASDLRRPD
ncbi:Pr6Pr family membrane protein [Paraburkholderia acidiphila]|uniref:FAR-17a/AIG1-like protein n=1 Tax=Paraburkholderia acidiphila TaxID=2571747 RepID=A0A7Z2GD74_9BURK|nr:Pr6Pr family membrane protein [Paraburkholderia acidiphila]QGZ59640.1 FAR-17a/AIG1-like protein [Paraburkholderia acidiphila]